MENNKKRAAGSGTTSGPRRERRQAIQWSALQQADQPVSPPADMEKQLKALKKATESAEKQLKELEKADKQAKRASSRSGKHGPRTEKAAETLKETLKKAPGNKPKLVSLEQIQKEQALEAKLASLKKELEKNASNKEQQLLRRSKLLEKGGRSHCSWYREKGRIFLEKGRQASCCCRLAQLS